MPLNADSGFHIGLALLPNRVPLTTLEDYENYIARLNSIPSYMDDHIALLREGIKLGMTVPQIVLNGYEFTIKTHVVKNPEKSVFYKPFLDIPNSVSKDEHQRLRDLGRGAVINLSLIHI